MSFREPGESVGNPTGSNSRMCGMGKANNFVPHLIHLVGKIHWIPLSPSSVYNGIQAQALFFIVQMSPDKQSS